MFIPKKGSDSSPVFTCAATTVVGTPASIQPVVGKEAVEMVSPSAVTFAEDCRLHPSRKGSVSAGAGAKLVWAAATAAKKNGISRRNVFIEISLHESR